MPVNYESAKNALLELVCLKQLKDEGKSNTEGYQRRKPHAWRAAREALVDCFRQDCVDKLIDLGFSPTGSQAIVWGDNEITEQVAIDEDPEIWAIECYCTE